MDQRIVSILRSDRKTMRFIASALVVILNSGEGKLDEAIDGMNDREPDMLTQVAGRPFSHWYGKTREQIAQEIGDDADKLIAVRDAFDERGIELESEKPKILGIGAPHRPPVAAATGEAVKKENATAASQVEGGDLKSPLTDPADLKGDANGAPVEEPKFAGHPLHELAGKSDEDLLKIEGIGRATINKIREAEQATKGDAK